jgi:glycosyltransferase involved in cell wall biosynthesis
MMATACWSFPVYSQTFVYQELTQLQKRGFELRFVYSHREDRKMLPGRFLSLWRARRKLWLNDATARSAYRSYCRRFPDKVNTLICALCEASDLSPAQLLEHKHFLQAFSFTQMVEAYDPDYLHSYFFYEGSLFALVAGFLLDIPRGISCYADHMLADYELKAVALHLDLCAVVVATSRRIKAELLWMSPGVEPRRVLVKPNAISAEHFPPSARREPDTGQPFHVTCVGRIDPKKGLIYLVDAVRQMRDRRINIVCHFAGGMDRSQTSSVDYSHQLEARIRELQLDTCVVLEGPLSQAEVSDLFHRSHVFVAPFVELANGDKDGIPTTLLEAMSTGLPVVATDAGSIVEVIHDGEDGVIVPQRDPGALADEIAGLLEDPDRRAEIGQNATAKIRAKYDVGTCEDVFHQRIHTAVEASPRN